MLCSRNKILMAPIKIKVLLFVLGVVGLSFATMKIPDHLMAPMRVMRKGCIAETGVDEKYINASRNGNLPDVPELGCYILCLLEHCGMIEDDGTIHFNDVLHLLTPSITETVKYVTEECKTKHGNTRCETAWLTFKCYYEKAPEGAELP